MKTLTQRQILAAIATMAATGACRAQTMTVDIALNDISDFGGAQRVADLPGPDGHISLREAITAANNTPGPQTIAFAIPRSEWGMFASDRAIIVIEDLLILSDDATTIDFTTQVAFTGNTNLAGNEVGIQYTGVPSNIPYLYVSADNCLIRGLDVTFGNAFGPSIRLSGNNNQILGCTTSGFAIDGSLGAVLDNIVGGTLTADRNTFTSSGSIVGAERSIVVGNTIRGGIVVQGATQYGLFTRNNRIGGPTAAERNVIAGGGRYGEEGFPIGTMVTVIDAEDTLIEGNYIGTTADGMARQQPQIAPTGIEVRDARNTTIRGNLIAGFRTVGINHYQGQVFGEAIHLGAVNGTTQGVVVTGNRIGLAADGVTPITTYSGIAVIPLSSVRHVLGARIGGHLAGEGNEVAAVETFGIAIASPESGVIISGNSIHNCGTLGIDLLNTGAGVTLNDSGDADTGANALQNFPVITVATSGGASVHIEGTLNSLPSQSFVLEFFANPTCDPSGFGEGKTFLGYVSVTTNASGNAPFSITLPMSEVAPQVVTSTARQALTGSTSEFSACFPVTVICSADFNGDGIVDFFDYLDFVDAFASNLPSADFNSDGIIDFFDYLDFVDAFSPGC